LPVHWTDLGERSAMKIDIIRGARAWVGAHEADLASRIENALQALAKTEASFWVDRQSLLEWPGPEALKERFLSQLEMHHAREKDLIVQRLAALRHDLALLSMSGSPQRVN
jgi:hypothetical protein